MSALAENHTEAIVPVAATPVELLRIAVSQNADIDKLQKLMDLQERWERREAKKAYDQAMKQFKADPPRISKNARVNFTTPKGTTDYRHSTLDHVCDQVIGALSKVGISHRWKVEQDKEWIKVTCILTHELGHSEETTLVGAPDNSGSKNSIQAIGSTTTYLSRYTLLSACGLAAGGQDDDGRSDGRPTRSVPNDEVHERLEWILNCSTLEELQRIYRDAYKQAADIGDQQAIRAYIAAKDRRKKELQ